jgi:hypothetical protein
MVEGTKFKVKNLRETFTFLRYAVNATLGTDWVDCLADETKQFKSFRPDRIKGVVKPKRPRKRRAVKQ